MRRIPHSCAIGVSLWWAVVGVSQSPPTEVLSEVLRTHLQTEGFQIVTSIRGLPIGVRDQLQRLFGSGTLDIAEPGAEFQRNGAPASPPLPIRRLVAAGCASDFHCLVYYERGGVALTWRVALFHWTPADTRFEWGGPARGGFARIEDVRKAVVSGEIKGGQAGPW